jgi:hypothetical protein
MDFEKLGVFYLGRTYDLAARKSQDRLLLYDSKDLVTHAVCVGMTGSGKTGLCIALLEEAAIDHIPALVIDPKGDLANLLLTFPELRAEDFAPWVDADDAQRRGIDPAEFPDHQAKFWKQGLAQWGQDSERIRRLRNAAEFRIYTPGSTAGVPVSVLKSFAAPGTEILDDRELLRDRIQATVTALLALVGIDADPLQSREHILLSTLLDRSWREGRDLDLAALIGQIQTPPLTRIGVLDLEAFYPEKDRFKLAMLLNNLLASPGFEVWLEGEPLDVDRLLYTAEGKPRIAIFSIAHLNDAERMFFVSLLLNQTVTWMRAQPGASSLRALLYMDEIFGYFPPVSNPPSKTPLLTLLKQARAFGLGVVLATQNPVDLDYKGLANAGTWFIGRLQTDRDKERVLDGLEGAAAGAGGTFDRQRMEQLLAALGSRIFLMNNVHDDAPQVFETRWCLSYLRGPMTRSQIRMLTSPQRAAPALRANEQSPITLPGQAPFCGRLLRGTATAGPPTPVAAPAPAAPAGVAEPAHDAVCELVALAQVRFTDARRRIDYTREVSIAVPIEGGVARWQQVREEEPISDGGSLAEPPKNAERDVIQWLYANQTLELYRSRRFGETSKPGESDRDFRIHLQQLAHERRDLDAARLRQKYAPKIAALQDRILRAEQAVEREKAQEQARKASSAISIGSTLLSAFLGRSVVRAATTSARSVARSRKETLDVRTAEQNLERLREQLAALEQEFESETQGLGAEYDPMNEPLEPVRIRPKKAEIVVRRIVLRSGV